MSAASYCAWCSVRMWVGVCARMWVGGWVHVRGCVWVGE